MLNPADPVVQWAAFGRQTELWAQSDVGVFLIKKAGEMREKALDHLRHVNCHEWENVQLAQNEVKVAETILSWLGETIQAGYEAIEELKNAQS